ncbi:hypothetical protein UlMin_041320 [Ulmus minor]
MRFEMLMKPFSGDEVTKSLMDMHPTRSLGSDGSLVLDLTSSEICTIFGITQVEGHAIYLGLPTFSMQNKHIQFGYNRERVCKTLQGWKEKLFSQGSKEILIGAVIQAIPTYVMSCFIIPDSIIRDIEVVFARFWWGSTEDHERVHWQK